MWRSFSKEWYKLLALIILIFLSVALLLVALDNLILMNSYVIVEGVVLDDKGYPVTGAEVSIGNYTTLTDASGNYRLRVPCNLTSTLKNVTARAPGFCKGSASINFSGRSGVCKCNVRLNRTAEATSYCCSRRIYIEGKGPKLPVFLIRGRTYTCYVRTMVGEVYDNGSWLLPEDAPYITYAGEYLSHDVVNFTKSFTVNIEIQPLISLSGFIPAMKNPNKVSTVSTLQYFPQQQIFFSNFSFTQPYNITYTIYDFDPETLKAAKVSENEKYTSVPKNLLEKLRPLALNITKGFSSPFEKLVAIEEFLRRNYSYKPPENCTPAPAGVDPVEWFLFHTRCGYCTHFNSAFVLLARSIGIPARLCVGYLVSPSTEFQVVKEPGHAYAEVLFEGLGWIIFDATAPCNLCMGGSKPSLCIIYPKNGTFVSGSRITIVGEASGFYKNAHLSVNSTSFSLSYWNNKGQFLFENCTCIADGKLTVKVGVQDLSGNNLSGTVSFVVDNTPPSVEIIYPRDGMRIFESTIYINGTVHELNKGNLMPYINDTRFTLVEWDLSSGFFSFVNNTPILGRVTVEVSFRDLAGNVGSDIISFNSEARSLKRIPTRTVITRVSPKVLKGSWFSVEGSVSDLKGSAVSGLQVIIYIYSENKSQLIRECGRGLVINGFFNITCYIGKEVKVGKYQIVAYTCGNDVYDSSCSDPPITVAAETCIEVKAPKEVIMGRTFSVEGVLKENFSREAVANQTIILKVDDRNYTLQTDSKGMFTENCILWNPGNHTLNVIFEGTETYLNTAKTLTIRVLDITIEFITNSTLVRSEVAKFTGRVHAENLSLDFEDLTIKLDNTIIAETKTDSKGFFDAAVQIPSNQSLGSAVLTCSLKHYPRNVTKNVNILARTSLACHAIDKLHSKERFNVTVRLTDDHGQPITNAVIKLKCLFKGEEVEATNFTDNKGIAEFRDIKLKEGFHGNFTYTVSFEGNKIYLPCVWTGVAYVEAEPLNFILLIIFTILSASLCTVSALVWFRRRRKPLDKVNMEETKVHTSATQPAATNKITLEFPQIKDTFPNVWGLNEPLLIRVKLTDSEGKPIPRAIVKIAFNGEVLDVTTSEDGCANIEKVFESKGIKKVKAQFIDENSREAVCEATVKVVDYREEVVELFNSFIEKLKSQNRELRDDMTPRELQATIACQSTPEKHDLLETIVSVFEIANYSLHQVTRREYERMFLSIREFEEGLKIG